METEHTLHGGADERLMLLTEAAQTLIGSLQPEEVLPAILALSRRLIAADAYAVWRLIPAFSQWRIVASFGLSQAYQQSIISETDQTLRLPATPLLIEDVNQEAMLSARRNEYLGEGIRSLLVVPLCIRGRRSGTITFYYRAAHRFSDTEVRLATALTNLAASAIGTTELYEEQSRMRAEAQAAQRRQAFLAEAGAVLSASLDYETTLSTMARLAVPVLADWCAVDMLGEDGTIRRLAVAHADPAKVAWARELQRRYPPDPQAPRGVGSVLRSGEAEFYPDVTPEMIAAAARDAEHREILHQIGLLSAMIVPLAAPDRTLGAITFATTQESRRRYNRDDLALAEELARRAALAVDNARLYRAARYQNQITQTITGNATACLFMMDAQGRCTFMNPAAERVTGYTFAEVEGRILHDMIHHTRPDGTPYPLSECPIDRALPQNNPVRAHEDVFVRKDGTFFPVLCAASPIIEAGGPVGTVIEVRDITEERRAGEALQMQARVLESMSEGVSLSDERGVILYTNPAEDAMFGYAPGELIGKHVTVQNTYPPEENARIVDEVIEELKTRGVWFGEFDNVKKDGTPFTTYARITALEMSGKRYWVCVQDDITERKRAQAEREAALQENVRLLAEVQGAAALQRVFLRDVLFSVSEGKLRLCDSPADLPPALPLTSDAIPLTRQSLGTLRRRAQEAAVAGGFAAERWQDLITAVSEAAMNAVVHAGGGEGRVCAGDTGTLQVWIQDAGKGIAMGSLHRATLERGFTTAGSLGHGFWLMLKTADRMWLLTGAEGTTVVVEQDRVSPEPEWLSKTA